MLRDWSFYLALIEVTQVIVSANTTVLVCTSDRNTIRKVGFLVVKIFLLTDKYRNINIWTLAHTYTEVCHTYTEVNPAKHI